jgi:hypothetical protein
MRAIGLTALLVLIITATSAAAVVKGAKYAGNFTNSPAAITFKVSKDGKTVSGLRLSAAPNRCAMGGTTPKQSSRRASISKGRFTATVRFKATNGAVFATSKVKGQFVGRRGARGTVTTKFKDTESQMCSGTLAFTAKAG